MYLFDGQVESELLEKELASKVSSRPPSETPVCIAAIVFWEDPSSRLYSELKKAAAQRIGITYRLEKFSMTDESARVVSAIDRSNREWQVTGVIVQKPSKKTWMSITGRSEMEYELWWRTLVNAITPRKDVDGLHPSTTEAIEKGYWQADKRVLPATCSAVLHVLDVAKKQLNLESFGKVAVLGKSDLIGIPITHILSNLGCEVSLMGKRELTSLIEQKIFLKNFNTIITATGEEGLVNENWLSPDSILIDVGEPRGDCTKKAYEAVAFASPVPGGVGPLTVCMLMKNALQLAGVV